MAAIPSELLAQIANPSGPQNVLEMFARGAQQGQNNLQFGQQQQTRNALLQAGNMARSGNYSGAAGAAYGAGQFDVGQGFTTLDRQQREEAEKEAQRAQLMQLLQSQPQEPGGAAPSLAPTAPAQSSFTARKMKEARLKFAAGDEAGAQAAVIEAQMGPEAAKPTEQLSIDKALGDEPGTKYFREGMVYQKAMSRAISDKRAVSDLQFIYGTAKMLDPTGRVTDQDAAMAQLQGSMPARIWARIQRELGTGTGLSPDTRLAMLELGRRTMSSAREQAQEEYDYYKQTYGDQFNLREPGPLTPHMGESQNMQMPPQSVTPQSGSDNIPAPAVEALRQNPALRDQFDQKYGAGAADYYLMPRR